MLAGVMAGETDAVLDVLDVSMIENWGCEPWATGMAV